MIQLKRAYASVEKKDGYRILIDRLWPRGMSKEKEQLDLWLKDIAPSKELRQWFNHEADKFPEFEEKYRAELQSGEAQLALHKLKQVIKEHSIITLVYGAKDPVHNNAVVLKKVLEDK
jgi:uncharacterized protein YeaO (DUF488 family)